MNYLTIYPSKHMGICGDMPKVVCVFGNMSNNSQ